VLAAGRKLRTNEIDAVAFTSIAKEAGVRYVVFHKNILMAESFVTAVTGIRRSFAPIAEDDRVAIYRFW
jgi:hypothetical protein